MNISVLAGIDRQLPDLLRACGAQVTSIEIDDLKAEMAALPALAEDATADEQALRDAEIAELNKQIGVQQALLDAEAAAQKTVDDLAAVTNEESFQGALEAMANKPVDDDVTAWAKEVLGVGEEHVGKIDEMRGVLEAAAEEAAAETPETVDPVVPADPVP